jgi:hypothetical protein
VTRENAAQNSAQNKWHDKRLSNEEFAGVSKPDTNTEPAAAQHQSTCSTKWPATVAVIVPVYNHGQKIGSVLEQLTALGALVLVVNDGSTDDSGAIAERYAKKTSVHVLHHDQNQGKAAALQTGLREAGLRGYALALTCDADGQHLPADCLHLAQQAAASHAEHPKRPVIHIGHRHMPHAPLKSRLGRWWSNGAASALAWQKLKDTQSGLRVYPLPITTRLPHKIQGFAWEIEILVLAAWAEVSIQHHPAEVYYGSDRVSHFMPWRDTWRACRCFSSLLRRALFSRTKSVCKNISPHPPLESLQHQQQRQQKPFGDIVEATP